jgi:hypothetical protein
MHLILKNDIKIERFYVWLVLNPIKIYQIWNMNDVFILKVVNHFTLHLFNNWKWTKTELWFNYE